MKPRHYLTLLFLVQFLCLQRLWAQIPQVPAQLQFADITVRINPQAQREIQLDVDAQYRNPSYFKVKQDRVNLYLPIVERELRNQGVPEDFKYLVIQESGLIPDAVSTSNAVGFWQFKQGTAEEVGLRVDAQIDERKNIATSSRGAALYLKKHNSQLDNWMTALVSYQMGLGGAKSYFGSQYSGKKVVEVDRNTHWYFKKYLAHKIAYENQSTMLVSSPQRLAEVSVQGPSTMAALSKRFGVSEAHLKEFNKWAGNGRIPAGTYTLFYIKEGSLPLEPAVIKSEEKPKKNQTYTASAKNSPAYKQANSYPRISGNTTKASQPNQITVNELDGVQASKTTSSEKFSQEIGIKEKKFLRLNDLDPEDRVETGKYYYTEKKKSSADVETHIVMPGETLWSISQKYGIKLSSLKSKNRIRKDSELKVGMVLNLREPRKRGEDIQIVPVNQPAPQKRTEIASTESRPAETRVAENSPTQISENAYRTEARRVTHNVSRGETLFAISKKYGVSVDELKSWNNIGSQNIISIGQKLVIFVP
ncbi:LysM peptidoglycan-binding domain-containing protein [Algoriphagus aestuariicola]|uniref:LysM peptidoglycan-binding domain-containing protein n=1 Tax=Algoriphagus aestuariicola TaxID=1852016 RepID=A0ABS3BWA7_9BACT|nr:lytic transglycosylase domain-containing protein [Algoriphagus aestuariicola]MBN7803590.1 LysM peptidoglycan-binding domain-containing protein [Algoriphagus aestuariicola]